MDMTRIAAGVAALIVAAPAGGASAQEQGKWAASARGGVAVPTSDLADLTDPGPTVGATVRYRVRSGIAVRVDGELDLLDGLPAGAGEPATPDTELWRALAGADYRLPLGSPRIGLRVHALGGVTSYNTDVFPEIVFEPGTGDPVGDFSETYPTAAAGLTASYGALPYLDVFVRGSWTVMLTDEDDTAIFGELRPGAGGFDQGYTVPVTVGATLRF